MNAVDKYIFECAKEIVVAKLNGGTNIRPDKEGGEAVGEFFEAVYNKIKELADKVDA